MIHHPHLGNDFTHQLSMTEESDHGTLRDHNADRFGDSTHVGGGNVTAAESQRHVHAYSHGIEVPARGKDNSLATHDKPAIQLSQFFDGSAEIEIAEMS